MFTGSRGDILCGASPDQYQDAAEMIVRPNTHFPLWALLSYFALLPVCAVLMGLLVRRLRLVHPTTWEQLGRPTVFVSLWPGSILAVADRADANFRLFVFPFRKQSFQTGNFGTATLLWLVRITIGLAIILGLWSWWANP
jgi:hypothetical protein